MAWIWLGGLILFLSVEAVTTGLTSIWFACGCLVALIFAALGAQLWLQIAMCIIVSAGTLCFTRPIARKYLNPARKATNADRILSMVCVVTEDVDNIAGAGAVSVDGKIWTARSLTGQVLTKGMLVRAERIEGVKLIVAPVDGAENKKEEE